MRIKVHLQHLRDMQMAILVASQTYSTTKIKRKTRKLSIKLVIDIGFRVTIRVIQLNLRQKEITFLKKKMKTKEGQKIEIQIIIVHEEEEKHVLL